MMSRFLRVRSHYREISGLGSLARHAVAKFSAGCGYFSVHVWLGERKLQSKAVIQDFFVVSVEDENGKITEFDENGKALLHL